MIDHIGDILAIPFFAWLSYYFYSIPNRTQEESILFIFSFAGLLADLAFTFDFMKNFHGHPFVAVVAYFGLIYFLHILIFHCSLHLVDL